MPKPPVPEIVAEFLRRPNPCVIASQNPDGTLHTAATWYLWEDGRVLVNMADSRKRLDYLRQNPNVALTMLFEENWYRHVSIVGRVVTIEQDEGLRDIDRLSQH